MRIHKMVEKRAIIGILHKLGLTRKDIHAYTFESCSVVIGLKDRKNLIEVCYCPELIEQWEEPNNPLFQ